MPIAVGSGRINRIQNYWEYSAIDLCEVANSSCNQIQPTMRLNPHCVRTLGVQYFTAGTDPKAQYRCRQKACKHIPSEQMNIRFCPVLRNGVKQRLVTKYYRYG